MELEEEGLLFFIDLEWYEKKGHSFQVMAQARLCPSCRQKLGELVEEKVPVFDEKAGRVVFQTQMVPYGSNPFSPFSACCARDKGFISPQLPLLESIFRLFLAGGNQPLSLKEIREQLEEWMGSGARERDFSEERLQRVLEGDKYYGLRPFVLPEGKEAIT